MTSKEKMPPNEVSRSMRTPRTPEEFERTNVALAMKLSSERLRDGSASAQEILYWLKIGSPETQLNRRYMEGQITLNEAKVDEIKSVKRDAEMYEQAMAAMLRYRPTPDVIDGDFEDM